MALSQIDGVANLECTESDDSSAVFTYDWTKPGQVFSRTDDHLAAHFLVRDWDYDPLQ